MVGVPVRAHSRKGDDLGICHLPPPVQIGDVLERGRGEILRLMVLDVVEMPPHSPLAAAVRVAPVARRGPVR